MLTGQGWHTAQDHAKTRAERMANGDTRMASFIDTWIELKRKDGTVDRLFSHWILGRSAEVRSPRWSVIRDVLHWDRSP
jgi:hypothetical protein